jgi:ubiquinone/menaquinone biosynthesis C-methylase UbiE
MIAPSTGSLFDSACGSAEITEDVLKATSFQEVWANDISIEMLKKAQSRLASQRGQRVSWLNSDIFELNRDDLNSKFDTILCLGLLAHCGRLNELLAILVRMLRDNGSIILQSSLLNHPGSRLIKLVTDRRYAAGAKYKFSFYTLDQIVNAARETGLVVEEVRRFGVCIPFGDRLLGKANYWLERTFATSMRSFGGEAIFRLRKTRQ